MYKDYNARVKPLFYSLNLLFSGLLVAVAVDQTPLFSSILLTS